MKQQPPSNNRYNTFTAYGEDHVCINAARHAGNVIVMRERVIGDWTGNSFDTLTVDDMDRLASLDAEVLLLGTGSRQRFPRPELLKPLMAARKSLEVMDLHAACRTYNLLAGEGRKVAAALLFA